MRPTVDEWGLGLAKAVATRADCSRRQVGAVLVGQDNRVVSTGYNGSYPGGPSCLAGECPRAQSDALPNSSYDTGIGVCHALHAEQNCLLYASFSDTREARMYITDEPCPGCWKMLRGSGVVRVIWPEGETTWTT